jgi:hypothetical protein
MRFTNIFLYLASQFGYSIPYFLQRDTQWAGLIQRGLSRLVWGWGWY